MAFMLVEALKLVFLSAGLIVMVKEAFMPFLCEIFYPNLLSFWNSFRCFLSSPLYICIIINAVVLLIAATSTNFNHHHDPPSPPPPPPPPPSWDEEPPPPETAFSSVSLEDCTTQTPPPPPPNDERENGSEVNDDTMESTWKAIVGDKKAKKLTKSESAQQVPAEKAWKKELRKLETFNESWVSVRRDPSIGIDEFNQQVEAFINKFNQDMRLQRQESDQRFLDMIKRGL